MAAKDRLIYELCGVILSEYKLSDKSKKVIEGIQSAHAPATAKPAKEGGA
jgi:hypothetical protein